jgi:hypothetical protein
MVAKNGTNEPLSILPTLDFYAMDRLHEWYHKNFSRSFLLEKVNL